MAITPPRGGFYEKAQGMLGQASSTYSMQQKKLQSPPVPGKTAGGAIGAGMGGVAAGATIGSMFAPPYGTAIGAVGGGIAGLASYFLS